LEDIGVDRRKILKFILKERGNQDKVCTEAEFNG
jgi:hypothetical protein